jgi:hypothetical protein
MDPKHIVFNIKDNDIYCDNYLFKNKYIKDFLLIQNNDLKKKEQ